MFLMSKYLIILLCVTSTTVGIRLLYRTNESGYQSMYGCVTNVQIFGTILSDLAKYSKVQGELGVPNFFLSGVLIFL